MPRPFTEQERDAFLAEPHVAVLSVTGDAGRPPLTIPVWYGYEPGGNLTYFTTYPGKKTRKIRLIETAGALSLCMQQESLPYKYVTAEGTVLRADESPEADRLLPIVRRYLPEEAAQGFIETEVNRPNTVVVLYTIRPDRWSSLDFSEDMA